MNRYRMPGLVVISCMLLAWTAWGWAAGADAPADKEGGGSGKAVAPEPVKPAEPGDTPSLADAQRARVEKKLKEVSDELTALQEAETKVGLAVTQAQVKALEKVDDRDKLKERLEKGSNAKGVREYKAAYLMGVAQGRTFDTKYGLLQKTMKGLERQAKALPDDLKGRIVELDTQIAARRRTNREKMASQYETIYAYREALAIYVGIYKEIPEKKREEEKALKDKIIELDKKLNPGKDKDSGGSGGDWSNTDRGGGNWGR